MSRTTKTVLLVILFFGGMLFLTFATPGINEFARGLSNTSHLPIWIVGLLAPILFVFKKFGDLFRGIFGESGTEKEIRETNEGIRTRLAKIEFEVRRLDEWRTREVNAGIGRINAWERDVEAMRGQEAALDERFSGLLSHDEQSGATRDRLQSQIAELQATIAELRGAMSEDPDQ